MNLALVKIACQHDVQDAKSEQDGKVLVKRLSTQARDERVDPAGG